MSDMWRPHGLWEEPTRLLCPWDSPSKNTGVSCHVLLQGIFLTQGWNPHLFFHLHWQAGFFFFFTTESPGKPYKELPTMKCLWPLPCQKIKTKFLKLVPRMTRIYLVESALMLSPYPLGHMLWSQFDSSLSDHLWSLSNLFSLSSLP